MSWFDLGNALLNQGQAPGGAAPAASPGVSGSDYLRNLLMGGLRGAPSGLASLSPGAGTPPEMGGGDGSDPGGPAPSIDGLGDSDAAAAADAAFSGGRQGFANLGLNALGANPTMSFPNGYFSLPSFSMTSGVPGPTFSLGGLISSLASMFGGPAVSAANTGLGAAFGTGLGTRGGDPSGGLAPSLFGLSTNNGNTNYSGNNYSLSDAARGLDGGRGISDPDSGIVTGDPVGATPTQGDPTGQDSGDGPSGNGGVVGDGTAGGIGGSAPGGEGGAGVGSSGDGGGGGGGGGSSVICSELRRQGLMDDLIWAADERFGGLQTRAVRDGYRCWAQYIARGMKRSPWLTRIVSRLAIPWAYEMAYLMGARSRGSLLGRALMFAGLPFCAFLGKLRSTWRTA